MMKGRGTRRAFPWKKKKKNPKERKKTPLKSRKNTPKWKGLKPGEAFYQDQLWSGGKPQALAKSNKSWRRVKERITGSTRRAACTRFASKSAGGKGKRSEEVMTLAETRESKPEGGGKIRNPFGKEPNPDWMTGKKGGTSNWSHEKKGTGGAEKSIERRLLGSTIPVNTGPRGRELYQTRSRGERETGRKEARLDKKGKVPRGKTKEHRYKKANE